MVFLPFISGSKLHIKISYQTSKTASAAQWLTPEQTAGKNHPYFFTQCQVSGTLKRISCCHCCSECWALHGLILRQKAKAITGTFHTFV